MTSAKEFLVGEWLVQPALNRLSRGEATATLQPRFMDLLVFLAQHGGTVMSKDEILAAVWAKEFVSEGTLTHAIAVIRQTLGDNVRAPEYIETIPTRGYRLVAPVRPVEESPAPHPAGRPPGARPRKLLRLAASIAALGALAWVLSRLLPGRARPSAGAGARIVVMPFECSGPGARDYLASGITDDITTRLAAASGVAVISRTSAESCAKSAKSARQIGEELGVDYLVEGTVHWEAGAEDGDEVRVNAKLIRVADDTHLWVGTYRAVAASIFSTGAAIAGRVIQELGVSVRAPERSRLRAQPSQDADAYQAYLCGMRYRDQESRAPLGLAVAMFERAVALDPAFALAYAELAIAHARTYHLRVDPTPERLARSRAAVERALALQPDLPEAHLALGALRYLGESDYPGALKELDVAARDLPNDSALYAFMAEVHQRQGRWREARAESERVLSLDPQSYRAALTLGDTLHPLREYEAADRAFEQAANLMPDRLDPQLRRFWNYLLWDGTTQRARQVLLELPVPDLPDVVFYRFFLSYCERDFRGALDELAGTALTPASEPFWLAPKPLLQCLCWDALGDRAKVGETCHSALALLEEEARNRPEDPRVLLGLGYTHALLDHRVEAVDAARRATSLCPVARDAYDGPGYLAEMARICARAGDSETALETLESLLQIPGFVSVPWLRLDPRWDRLRDDPRFVALLQAPATRAPLP